MTAITDDTLFLAATLLATRPGFTFTDGLAEAIDNMDHFGRTMAVLPAPAQLTTEGDAS